MKQHTLTNAAGETLTYYVDPVDDSAHLRIAPITELRIPKKVLNRIRRTWLYSSDAYVGRYFQELAADIAVRSVVEPFSGHKTTKSGAPTNRFPHTWGRNAALCGEFFYFDLAQSHNVLLTNLYNTDCRNCNAPAQEHVDYKCLFAPTAFVSLAFRVTHAAAAILEVPVSQRALQYRFRSDTAAQGSLSSRHRLGVYHSSRAWRSAHLTRAGNSLALETSENPNWSLKALTSTGATTTLSAGGPLTVALTPDVLAFVRRVNQLLKNTRPRDFGALAARLPQRVPDRDSGPFPESLLPTISSVPSAIPVPK